MRSSGSTGDHAGAHGHRLARARAAALSVVVGTGLLMSACGSGSATALQSRLLSVTDLPAGWSAVANPASVTASAPCLSSLARTAGSSYVVAAFVQGPSIPNFGEVLATGPRVRQEWQALGHALNRCRTATISVGSLKVSATVRQLAFPCVVSGMSAAYAWSLTIAGIRITSDLVLFRTGKYAGYISYADLGSPAVQTVRAVVEAAVAKARTGSTTRVAAGISITSALVHRAHTSMGAVSYRVVGTGPPLVLITGYGGTMEGWDRLFVDALAQHYRVLIFDNAGVGQTAELRPLSIDAMANQTSALMTALHLGRSDVLGWSMGSMIAQALAVLHPDQVRRLVLCASYPGNGTAVPPGQAALTALKSGKSQQVMADLFPPGQTAAAHTYAAAISSYPAAPAAPPDVVAAQARAVDGWWAGTDPAGNQTAAIAVPTLVTDGTADRLDPLANSRTLAELIPQARLVLYPGAGHAFLFQDQAALVPLIESFLG